MSEEIRQPFYLNHEGETVEEIFKVDSVEELNKKVLDGNGWDDFTFAVTLYKVLNERVLGGPALALFAAIIEGIYDTEVRRVSELVQLLTNAILDEDRRDKIVKSATIVGMDKIKKTATPEDAAKILGELVKAIGGGFEDGEKAEN